MSDFDEHTRMWADEIVDRCYHDSHMYVDRRDPRRQRLRSTAPTSACVLSSTRATPGDDLWRCDQCGEVIRYIDDPNGNITLTELHPYKNRKVRTEVVIEGRWPS